MIRRSAALAGLVVAAALLTACGSPSTVIVTTTPNPPAGSSAPPPASTSSAPPAAQGPPSCATGDLQVYLGLNQGAAGHIYQVIDFKNISGRTCTLLGYPGVSFAAGTPVKQVGQAADEDPTTPRVTVTLAPGDVANALLSYTQAGFYTPSKCAQVSTAFIQVYPPNQTTPVYVAYSSQICSNKKIHELRIGTVHAGSGGG